MKLKFLSLKVLIGSLVLLVPFVIIWNNTNTQELNKAENFDLSSNQDSSVTYENETWDISFKAMTDWEILESIYPLDSYYAIDIEGNSFDWITINKESIKNNLELDVWFEQKGTNYSPRLKIELLKNESNKNIYVIGQPITCTTTGMVVAFIRHNQDIYIFSQFNRSEENKTALELIKIIESFKVNDNNILTEEIKLENQHFKFPLSDNVNDNVDCDQL